MWKSTMLPAISGLALLSAAVPPAAADILLYSEKATPQKWSTTLWQGVKLNGNGDLSLQFTNPSAGLVSVTFTAECQIVTSSNLSLPTLTINIIVDEDHLPVTNGDDALCSGGGANIGGRLSMRSFSAAINLAAGPHVLRVDAAATLSNSAQLDDITILVAR